MKLNLGHTIGHGVEAQSHYTISHGRAVAIGMAIVTRAAQRLALCSEETSKQITDVIRQFDLPITTSFDAESLYNSALSDKKRAGGTVNLIIPAAIGNCLIYPMEVEKLQSFIQEGL